MAVVSSACAALLCTTGCVSSLSTAPGSVAIAWLSLVAIVELRQLFGLLCHQVSSLLLPPATVLLISRRHRSARLSRAPAS